MFDALAAFIGAIFFWIFVLAFSVILGTLFGAISGWFIGLFFGEMILGVLAKAGMTGITMWELGGFLGFVSGYFRTVKS